MDPMYEHPRAATPGTRRGAASHPHDELRGRVLGAWDTFLDSLGGTPEPTTALVALGDWPGDRFLSRPLAEAGARLAPADDTSAPAPGREVDASARQPSGRELRAALERSRDTTAKVLDRLAAPDAAALAEAEAGSAYGPLPLLTQVHAIPFQLALALPESTSEEVADAACAALLDVLGALAFRRGLRATAAAHTTDARGWWFSADREGWTLDPSPGRELPGPEAPTAVLLGVAAGRGSVPALLARRELRLRRVPQLLALAPLLDDLPVAVPLPRAVTGLLGRLAF
jgi:hypothetical protein